MNDTKALVQLPLLRFVRGRRAWLPILGWSLLGIGSAVVARRTGSTTGADHTLRGTFAFVVVPLLAFAVVSAASGGTGLRPGVRGLVALGAAPRRAAAASIAVAMLVSALLCAVVGTVVCFVAHGGGDVSLARDLPATAVVSFASGATYAAFFCAGSAIGRCALRGFFLVADWVLGAPAGLAAVLVPRGHVMALFGGGACFSLSRTTSSIVLVLLCVVYAALALRLARR